MGNNLSNTKYRLDLIKIIVHSGSDKRPLAVGVKCTVICSQFYLQKSVFTGFKGHLKILTKVEYCIKATFYFKTSA